MGQFGSVWKRIELNPKCDLDLNASEFQGINSLCAQTLKILLYSEILCHIFLNDYSFKMGVKIKNGGKTKDLAK